MAADSSNPAERLDQEFGRLLEESLNEIYVFDADTLRFIRANRGARENLGYAMEELRELTPLDLKPKFTAEAFQALLEPLRTRTQDKIHFQTVQRRKDGSQYDVDVQLQLSTFHDTSAFFAFVSDRTERNLADERMRGSEARMRAILDNAVEAIISIDEAGVCTALNKAAERMFGYQADEVLGRNVSLLMPAPYREEHDGYIRNYLTTGQKKIIGIGREVVGRRKNGEEFPIYLSVSDVRVGDRRLFTGLIQDITERKRAEQRLVQAERLAAVGEAITRLAHESRNYLQRIQIAVETARLHSREERDFSDELGSIERASDGLNALLEEVRNYASPMHLDLSEVPLPEIWQEAWASIGPLRAGRQAELRQESVDQGLCCRVDRFRMTQVFRNLFENSLSACSDPVEITIRASASNRGKAKCCQVQVADNGPGLTQEQAARIFEPFFTTKAKGTGLGMAIAHRVLEAHGGRISVAEDGADGAAFLIELPT